VEATRIGLQVFPHEPDGFEVVAVRPDLLGLVIQRIGHVPAFVVVQLAVNALGDVMRNLVADQETETQQGEQRQKAPDSNQGRLAGASERAGRRRSAGGPRVRGSGHGLISTEAGHDVGLVTSRGVGGGGVRGGCFRRGTRIVSTVETGRAQGRRLIHPLGKGSEKAVSKEYRGHGEQHVEHDFCEQIHRYNRGTIIARNRKEKC